MHESNDVAVTVRAKGIGTPVMCRESYPGDVRGWQGKGTDGFPGFLMESL